MSTDHLGPEIGSTTPATTPPDTGDGGYADRITNVLGILVGWFDWFFTQFRKHWLYCRIERPIRWFIGNPLLSGQIALYVGIAWGIIGSGLGLTDLFWNEVPLNQFSVGVAASWLFGTILFVNVLLRGFPPDRLPDSKTDANWSWWVLASLFPSYNPGLRRIGLWVLGWLVAIGVIVYLGKMVAISIAPKLHKDVAGSVGWEGFLSQNCWFGIGYVSGFLAIYLLSLLDAFVGLREAIAKQPWLPSAGNPAVYGRPCSPHAAESRRPGLQSVLQPVVASRDGHFSGRRDPGCPDGGDRPTHQFQATNLPRGTPQPDPDAPRRGWGTDRVPGAGARTFAVIVFLWVLIVNSESIFGERMSYPNLPSLQPEVELTEDSYENTYRKQSPAKGLIGGKELLEKFQKRWQDPEGKGIAQRKSNPRLVVIAVSGGGIRAAVWTAVVMEGLEGEFPSKDGKAPIRDHVRIFAGASGGMVGAAAYSADFEAGSRAQDTRDDTTGLMKGSLSEALAEDSLSPIIQTMLVNDFTVKTLLPIGSELDRGRKLEAVWKEKVKGRGADQKSPFARSMRELHAKELTCERPSLIFAPVMIEDTKRLLISNLDLDPLTDPKSNRLDALGGPGVASLGRPGVEFFRLFPNATDFEVGSAARMSATFPVVSPAVAIPVKPRRRVVDAGYFDNYGIDVLANWLLHHRADVMTKTSGVLLIEIRAYPLEEDGMGFPKTPQSPVDSIIGAVSPPLQALTTARSWAAYHRNNTLLAELHRVFNATPQPADFFTTVTFEQKEEAALSWYLTTGQKRQVVEGFFMQNKDRKWTVREEKDNPRWNVKMKLEKMGNWFGTGGK